MTEEEIDRMADNFVNTQDFTKVYSVARKAECGAFWKYGFLAGLKHKQINNRMGVTMFEKEAEELIEESKRLNTTPRETVYKAIEFGYNKANEWHYVKDGDLPKEFDKPYLCRVFSHFEVGYFTAYKEQPWHFDEYYLDNEDVIAWKEIELPKEIKENE